jgi:hypothetical protein
MTGIPKKFRFLLPVIAVGAALALIPILMWAYLYSPLGLEYWTQTRWQITHIWRDHPVLGSTIRVGINIVETSAGRRYEYHSTRLSTLGGVDVGIRETAPLPARPCGLLVGDSIVEGFEVSQDDVISAVLSRRLNCRFLNLGSIGYGTTQELELYKTIADKYRAPVVLQVVIANDPSDNVAYAAWLQKARAEGKDFTQYKNSLWTPSFASELLRPPEIIKAMRLNDVWSLESSKLAGNDSAFWEKIWPRIRAAGDKLVVRDCLNMRDLVKSKNGFYAAVVFQNPELAALLKKKGLPVLDLDPGTPGTHIGSTRIWLRWGSHFNAAGHAWAANRIMDFLSRRHEFREQMSRYSLGKS